MMRKWNNMQMTIGTAGLLTAVGAAVTLSRGTKPETAAGSAVSEHAPISKIIVAGPGLVEPNSEDVKVGSQLAGKLKEVLVEEGDHVKKNQILAVLINDDYKAQVDTARAQARQAEAAYHKILSGSRPQEREESAASLYQTEATEANARGNWDRRLKLFDAGVISREELERYRRDFDVAEQQHKAAWQHFHLVDDRPREEDIAVAKAQLEAARAQLSEADAAYAKTFLHAPFAGLILRKHHRTGESITNSSVTPDPVFTMGEMTGLRVRVDVDETDVSRVAVGQKVYCNAKAYGDQRFLGRVIRVAGQLGHKNLLTDEPKEKTDSKILETLVQLDQGVNLPVGLRVDAYIQTQ